ncbi:MAG: hypothetical protein WAN30_07710 [Acidimicrobiales bacterium]
MNATQGQKSKNGFERSAMAVWRVATAPLTSRQIRRVILVGSLALPLSATLLWSSISPVSASSHAVIILGVSHQLAPSSRAGHASSNRAIGARNVTPDEGTVTARVAASSETTAVPRVKVARSAPSTQKVTKPVVATTSISLQRLVNPAANIVPSPNFLQAGQCSQTNGAWSCTNPCITPQMTFPVSNDTPACTGFILLAINNARAVEGLPAMELPSNWYSLSVPEQLFVVANLERIARDLPPYLGINAALSAQSQQAAQGDADPTVANGFAVSSDPGGYPAMGGAWSGGFNVLAADYMWMYDDGWGGNATATSNIACTSASALGCWAHRDELLGSDPGFNPGVGLTSTNCEMGVGYAVVGGSGSYVDLIERPAGNAPAMTFTWAQEVAAGL